MPWTIRLAMIALGLVIVNRTIVAWATYSEDPLLLVPNALQILCCGYVMTGTVYSHRGAWQFGLLFAAFGLMAWMVAAVFLGFALTSREAGEFLGLGLTGREPGLSSLALPVVNAVSLFVVLSCYSMRSAKAYFDLICPKCGNPSEKPADLFFSRVKCTTCGHVWARSGEEGRSTKD